MSTQDTAAQTTQAAASNTSTTQETTSTQAAVTDVTKTAEGQSSTQAQTTTTQEVVFDLKLPDGTTLTKEHSDKIASFAKENGLTPVQAQKILERDHASIADRIAADKAARDTQYNNWVKQVQEDKILGGEKFAANMEIAKRGFEKFASPEFTKLLRETGYGSHPEVVRMFHAIGQAISDDTFNKGGSAGSEASTLGGILYGK